MAGCGDSSRNDRERETELTAEKRHTEDIPVTLGSRAVLMGFFEMNGMSAKAEEIMAVLAEYESIGEEAVRQRLINDVRMLPCKAETLLDFVSDKGSLNDTLFALEQYRGIVKSYDTAVEDFKAVISAMLARGVPAELLKVKLSCTAEG